MRANFLVGRVTLQKPGEMGRLERNRFTPGGFTAPVTLSTPGHTRLERRAPERFRMVATAVRPSPSRIHVEGSGMAE